MTSDLQKTLSNSWTETTQDPVCLRALMCPEGAGARVMKKRFFHLMEGRLNQRVSLVAQLVRKPPAMLEIPVRFLGSGRFPGEGIGYALQYSASLVTQMVKNLPVIRETWVWSLGWEDPLEKEMATDSSILAWRIPEEPGGLQSTGLERVGHGWVTQVEVHSTGWIRRYHTGGLTRITRELLF